MTQPAIDADRFRAFEAKGWEAVASPYHTVFGPVTVHAIDALLDAAGVRPGTRLLDVATGRGDAAGEAARRGAAVTGVDIAAAMVELAALRHPGIDFRQADAERLPFAAGAFDAVVSNFGLGHFARPEHVVAELARVLAPGGRLALAWWDLPERNRLLGLFADAMLAARAEPPPDLPPGPPIFRFSDATAFARLLEGAGLEDVGLRALSLSHRLSGPDELWAGILAGTVRTAAAIRGQTEAMQRAIRAAFDDLAAPYVTAQGFDVPVSIHVAAGRARGTA